MSDEIYPPRYWRLKRLVLAGAGLIVALLLLHLAWGGYANYALAREIEAMRSRGEPTRPEDLIMPFVKDDEDDENAAYFWKQAYAIAQGTGVDSPAASALEYANYPPFPKEWHDLGPCLVPVHGAG